MKNTNIISYSLLLLLILLVDSIASAQTTANAQAPKTLAVRAARMLDVKSGNVIADAVILIENGRITATGSKLSIPAGAEVIDLGSAMVLPGLIDSHTHLLMNYSDAIGGDDSNMI
ncbi:MAG: hypothetical protein H0U54_19115, partial [Acidobacteria bacterium]|nr:hypothetical protein [Acidobacteriota bacterium]